MNDETTKEIEDLSTLACSTDEVLRKRALVAILARVVGRATQVDHEGTGTDIDDADRYALEANLREAVQQVERERDHWHQKWETAQNNADALARDLAGVRDELADTQRRMLALTRAPPAETPAGTRTLMDEEFADLVQKSRRAYEVHDGNALESHRAMLRWMEREGYLSVRLPPEG